MPGKTFSKLDTMRHSTAHVMAAAVLELFPEAKLGIGPPIENGFFYDFELSRSLGPDDLPAIESRMQAIAAQSLPFERFEQSVHDGLETVADIQQSYKVELINDLKAGVVYGEGSDEEETREPVETVSFFRTGDFLDLCQGPHVSHTGEIGPFKLLSVAGAYWRGNANNPQMQRIYGTVFFTQEELDQYLWQVEEAKRRDHRKLGAELELFTFHELAPASPFWLPKGTVLFNILTEFSRSEQEKRGYVEARTPNVMKVEMWKRSGHYEFYRDKMYIATMDDAEYAVKPMNCPGATVVYSSKLRSYRDLPLRLAEYGMLQRYEASGTLHGLLRVRQLFMDDAHIFAREDQIQAEVAGVLSLIDYFYSVFDMPYKVNLSTKPEKAMGADALWERAETALQASLAESGGAYELKPGDGAFYGPKLDIDVTDSLGREWQLATVQLDFQLPEKFDLTYIGEDGKPHRPVMIHRAILGTFERFIGILIEHYAGAFPVWLAPLQVMLVPIADRHVDYANQVASQLQDTKLRVEVDDRRESMRQKIRQAQLKKVPYMLIVGDREAEQGAVAVRLRSGDNLGALSVAEFLARVQDRVDRKTAEL
ncbi:MAG: threonine--tRNA ligase [bacterium]|nr:threonine--tRNA ligase [bacterium]